ncbi:MAG: hypothetical protein RLZZ299_1545 [Pseudomonadota bacterium]
MAEFRTCPVTGRTVLLRPDWVDAPPAPAARPGPCPACRDLGVPHATFGEVRVFTRPDHALALEGDPRPRATDGAVSRDAFGAHEWLVGPHVGDDAVLLEAVARRAEALRRDGRLRGIHAGRRILGGAHAAWHLLAVPWDVAPEPLAAWRTRERADPRRVLHDGDGAFAALAWAPRTPFEAWVCPASGEAAFGPSTARPVGRLLGRVVRWVREALRGASVDLVLVDGAPWRVEVRPNLAATHLVESFSGVPVHGVAPEEAAAFLRRGGWIGARAAPTTTGEEAS